MHRRIGLPSIRPPRQKIKKSKDAHFGASGSPSSSTHTRNSLPCRNTCVYYQNKSKRAVTATVVSRAPASSFTTEQSIRIRIHPRQPRSAAHAYVGADKPLASRPSDTRHSNIYRRCTASPVIKSCLIRKNTVSASRSSPDLCSDWLSSFLLLYGLDQLVERCTQAAPLRTVNCKIEITDQQSPTSKLSRRKFSSCSFPEGT